MPRPPASQKAFTLIEVMMAATVLVVSFTAVIQAVMMGADMIDTARKQQVAQQIIEGEIGGLRMRPWGSGNAGDINCPAGTVAITIDGAGTAQGTDMPSFALTNFTNSTADDNTALLSAAKGFTVSRTSTDIRPNFRQFTYTVTWSGYLNRHHTRTGVAYFGQNGLHLSYQK